LPFSFDSVQSKEVVQEQFRPCSACCPAEENSIKKSQKMLVWLSKMALAQHFCISCRGRENVQQSLTPAGDQLNSLIGPGGLVSTSSPSFNFVGRVGKKVNI
jgi:hypothetical protein